jgi:diaminopimelate epimerase
VISFFKLSGSGNDFIALAEPSATPSAEQIRAWCRRGLSVGADGLFVLRRAEAGDGRLLMDYWNADGKPADLCLNGTRCAAQLGFHLGWAERQVVLETGSGSVEARQLDDRQIALELPPPPTPTAVSVELSGEIWHGWRCPVGVPHFVLSWPTELENAPVVELGRGLRHHPDFGAAGTNVNFARFVDHERIAMRTYERGVEDETLACGSGAIACAAVGVATGATVLPVRIATRGGCTLTVASASGRWTLAGDARLIARGEILAGALLPDGV